jgi:hypothetical protein
VIVNVRAAMGIHAPFIRTGAVLTVMMDSAVPISGKFIIDLSKKKTHSVVDTWPQQQMIVRIVSEPVCVVKHLPTVRTHSNWATLGKKKLITNNIQPTIKVWYRNTHLHCIFYLHHPNDQRLNT